tara:strand:+ start:536 stop:1114 length:579 start_codon:yes stop_codon:yes gene_type:complete
MTSNIIISKNDVNIAMINGLLKRKWFGKFTIEDNNIIIQSENSYTLDKYIVNNNFDYNDAFRFVFCLGILLASLVPLNKSFLFLSLSDITIINKDWYIITNTNKLVNIIENNNIILDFPIKIRENLIPPEIKNINTLPFITNISCIYYNIALLTIYCMKINVDLSEIKYSKLYFFLKRCLLKKPENRYYILI